MEIVKIPKKFADICELIRNSQPEGLKALYHYDGLEHQKTAVLAEVAYFDGDFAQALAYDREICPYWNEWKFSNVHGEHLAAMAFAAREVGQEREIARYFSGQAALALQSDAPEHIQKTTVSTYQAWAERLRSNTDTNREAYQPVESPLAMEALIPLTQADYHKSKKKVLDMETPDGQVLLFHKTCSKGSAQDLVVLYEKVADQNLSTMWHLKALSAYQHLGKPDQGLAIVLRMAKQRLWFVASPTQVRPMEFFTHSTVLPYLKDKATLAIIKHAACNP